ncbi:MAG: GlxA family transcriptional regulator [Phenylobacterium sp.]|uniref:GlxA family transcriptional regulator n=1 Tax=Phenylobacterium sp. TaxID=1871053 RepID=UPI0012044D6C|nr:GlxA family transcriptional regulator [Phenylobacterium sp.]TAL38385.1 MAG: GlxA family transcriptional regulator [Phenylobacterium sp.]
MTRKLAVVVFPNFQLLDAAGPLSAFDIAGRYSPGAYETHVLAPGGGHTLSTAGAGFACEDLADAPPTGGDWDTILVSGGDATRAVREFTDIVAWLKRVAPTARRVTSVCSGAYFLAEAGLLDGRRATTHWSRTDHFARRYPKIRLDADRIFIRDGNVWTSGGITAGIDLTLALIEDDLGPEVARRTAQQLVVHQRRPGGQSQFSALVEMGGATGRFAELMDWMRANLAGALTVERLAERAAMSPRNFARAFTSETGTTPAKAVERLRLEAARTAVETSHAPIDHVAEAVGFGDPERMRRAFLRAFGQPPQSLRRAARA